jgi:hypothetical protein
VRADQRSNATSPTSPCENSENTFASAIFAVQAVGAIDVGLTRSLAATAVVRLTTPTKDVGSSDIRLLAGARVGW